MVNYIFFNIDDEAIMKMIEAADSDGSGKISKYEFLRVMKKVKLLWSIYLIIYIYEGEESLLSWLYYTM